jgi:putative ABC transport system permease protein
MIKTYFLTAIRSLRRDAPVTVINVVGMAVALACCLIIGLYVWQELRVDQYHERADRVVRIVSDITAPNTPTDHLARSSRPVADALRDQFPDVERAARLTPYSASIKVDDTYRFDQRLFFAEEDLLDILSFNWIDGDSRGALREPYKAIITEHFAQILFGQERILGETLVLNDSIHVTIEGVVEDTGDASHLQFDLLISYPTFEVLHPAPAEPAWLELNVFTYALLRPGANTDSFRRNLRGLAMREYGSVLESVGVRLEYDLERLSRIHLHSDRLAQHGPTSDVRTVRLFAAIAVLILLIACINYTNLATARSMYRAREIGVRKTLGAGRGELIGQFLSEACVMTLFAMAVAIFLAAATLGWFNNIAGTDISLTALAAPQLLVLITLIILIVGLAAGFYPAIVLSGQEAAAVVRGTFHDPGGARRLRQALVVLQFAASIVLIAATIATLRQLQHMRSHDLGFEAEHLVVVRAQNVPPAERARRFQTARDEVKALPNVQTATASASAPGDIIPLLLTVGEGLPEGESRRMHYLFVDEEHARTYRLRLVAGRFFDSSFESDATEHALINVSAVESLGWGLATNAIGRWVQMGANRRTVIGVFEDYHHFALRQPIEPMIMMISPRAFTTVTVRVEPGALAEALPGIQALWSEHFPGYPFQYSLVTDAFEDQYLSDRRMAAVMGLFAALAVLVASLGLFGLAAHTTTQRRKEIGVRKAMGAGVSQIVAMLVKSVIGLVAIATILALPIAYLAIRAWSRSLPYPAPIQLSDFIIPAVFVLAISLASVSVLTTRAAIANPSHTLRDE